MAAIFKVIGPNLATNRPNHSNLVSKHMFSILKWPPTLFFNIIIPAKTKFLATFQDVNMFYLYCSYHIIKLNDYVFQISRDKIQNGG